MKSSLAMYEIAFKSRQLEITVYQGRKRQRGGNTLRKIKDGLACKKLRTAMEKFEKSRLNFSKKSSVTELL